MKSKVIYLALLGLSSVKCLPDCGSGVRDSGGDTPFYSCTDYPAMSGCNTPDLGRKVPKFAPPPQEPVYPPLSAPVRPIPDSSSQATSGPDGGSDGGDGEPAQRLPRIASQ